MTEDQREICARFGANSDPPPHESVAGVAVHTLSSLPLNGVRVEAKANICGWYIWGGEFSDATDFFTPMCLSHLATRLPQVTKFLALPERWRFLTDGDHIDVWFDPYVE